MKRLLSISLAVLIVVVFIPFQTSAQLNVHSIDECYKTIFNLHSDMVDIEHGSNAVDATSLEALGDAIEVLINCEDALAHLRDLLLILKIVTNKSEREQISDIINKHVNFTLRSFDAHIKFINVRSVHAKNLAIISLINQSKVDMRKIQEIIRGR
jgi:hypothetical protein